MLLNMELFQHLLSKDFVDWLGERISQNVFE